MAMAPVAQAITRQVLVEGFSFGEDSDKTQGVAQATPHIRAWEAKLQSGPGTRQGRQFSAPGNATAAGFENRVAPGSVPKGRQQDPQQGLPVFNGGGPFVADADLASESSTDASGALADHGLMLAAVPRARRRRSSWAAGAWPTPQMTGTTAAGGLEALSPDDLYRQFVAIRDAVLQKTSASDGRSSCPSASLRRSALGIDADDTDDVITGGGVLLVRTNAPGPFWNGDAEVPVAAAPAAPILVPPLAKAAAAPATATVGAAQAEGGGMADAADVSRRRAPAQHRAHDPTSGIRSPHRLSHATYADNRLSDPDIPLRPAHASVTAVTTAAQLQQYSHGHEQQRTSAGSQLSPPSQPPRNDKDGEGQPEGQGTAHKSPQIMVDLQHFFRSPPPLLSPFTSPCASPSGEDEGGVPRPLSPFQDAVSYASDCMTASPACNNALFKGGTTATPAGWAESPSPRPVAANGVAAATDAVAPTDVGDDSGACSGIEGAPLAAGQGGQGPFLMEVCSSIPHTDSLFSLQPSGEPQPSLRGPSIVNSDASVQLDLQQQQQESQLPQGQQARPSQAQVCKASCGRKSGGGTARMLVWQEDLAAEQRLGGSGDCCPGVPVRVADADCGEAAGAGGGVLSEEDMVLIGRCTPAGGMLPVSVRVTSDADVVASDANAVTDANEGNADDGDGSNLDGSGLEDGEGEDDIVVREDVAVRSASQCSDRSTRSRCTSGGSGERAFGAANGFTSDYQIAMDSAAKRTFLPLPGMPTVVRDRSCGSTSAGSSSRSLGSAKDGGSASGGAGSRTHLAIANSSSSEVPPLPPTVPTPRADPAAVPASATAASSGATECSRSPFTSYVPLPLPGLPPPARAPSGGRHHGSPFPAACGSPRPLPSSQPASPPPWLPSSPSLVSATNATVRKCLDKGLPFAVIANKHFAEVVAAAEQHDGPLAFHVLSNHCTYFPGIGRHATSNGGAATDLLPHGTGSSGGNGGGGGFGGGLFRRHASAAATTAAANIRRLLEEGVALHVMSPCEYQRLVLAVQYGVRQLHDMLVAQPAISTAAAAATAAATPPSTTPRSPGGASIGRMTLPIQLPHSGGGSLGPLVRKHRRGSSIGSENSFTAAVVRFKSVGDAAPSAGGALPSAGGSAVVGAAGQVLQPSSRVRALVAAALQGNVARVAYLVDHGADVNATESPTHHRHNMSHPLLGVRDGASPATTLSGAAAGAAAAASLPGSPGGSSGGGGVSGGRTALHYAAESGSFGVVQLLLHYGAFVGVRDSAGRTAYDLARRKGHEAVAQLLKDAAERRRDVVRSCAAESKAAAAAATATTAASTATGTKDAAVSVTAATGQQQQQSLKTPRSPLRPKGGSCSAAQNGSDGAAAAKLLAGENEHEKLVNQPGLMDTAASFPDEARLRSGVCKEAGAVAAAAWDNDADAQASRLSPCEPVANVVEATGSPAGMEDQQKLGSSQHEQEAAEQGGAAQEKQGKEQGGEKRQGGCGSKDVEVHGMGEVKGQKPRGRRGGLFSCLFCGA